MHKSGFVNIIGSPNVGKSTLMNKLVGERLSIITSKAQTTRHRIMGIVNGEDFQIVYSDTPGIVNPAYKLHESMLNYVYNALQDADVLLVVVEIGEKGFKNPDLIKRINEASLPTLVLVNKIDLSSQEELEEKVEFWNKEFPQAEILPISALHNLNVDLVLKKITELLPESPPYFPKDQLTDKPMRFFVSEIIREKLLLHYKKEIPYAAEVVVESYKEEKDIVRTRAEIYVERDSQKGILIGKGGKALKQVGIDARKDIEAFVGKQVFLDLYVKVDKNWRSNANKLKRFGYIQ
ncbi:GTPase Era [Salibacter halophilus]|uniref:GTPase Era n=1 Tax=Salibacter halophilus TaxID=1803916 RepID=A0A6N6M4K2_9FLAO|nr:GTPase Era [Salibacter halophilus]KAB1062147.1 GTPase Era [Salibacter halophilus]